MPMKIMSMLIIIPVDDHHDYNPNDNNTNTKNNNSCGLINNCLCEEDTVLG